MVEAENRLLAAQAIKNEGVVLVSITEVMVSTDISNKFNQWYALNNITISDIIIFSRQMYSLSKAGVPLFRALRSLSESTRNKALAAALKDIASHIESGLSLSQAMTKHKKVFSPLFISIVHVGELSGEMDKVFLQMANYMQREKKTQSSIKSALRYPSMVLIAISIAMVIINIYVIPSFKGIFTQMHAELPWQTQLLMNISNFTVNYWQHIAVGLVVLATIMIRYINTSRGRLQWDWFLLHIPAIGSLVKQSTMERFSRSFAMILHAGVPLTQGLVIVSSAIGNSYIASKLNKMRIGIEKGDSISNMVRSTELFTPLVVQMIMVGEETGNIGDMLVEVADFYEMEVDTELNNLSSVIEPILIVVIGAMVLVLALGIFLPMWNLSTVMH